MEFSSFIKTNLIEKHYWFDSIIFDEVFGVVRGGREMVERKMYDG